MRHWMRAHPTSKRSVKEGKMIRMIRRIRRIRSEGVEYQLVVKE